MYQSVAEVVDKHPEVLDILVELGFKTSCKLLYAIL